MNAELFASANAGWTSGLQSGATGPAWLRSALDALSDIDRNNGGRKIINYCARISPGRVVRVNMLEHVRRPERANYLVMASGRASNIHHKPKTLK